MQEYLCGVDDSLVVGGNMEITVLEVHDDHVRLGISLSGPEPSYREENVYLAGAQSSCELQLH
jgi:hypothetical protein